MDLEIVLLSKVSQKQIPYDIVYIWNLKKKYKWIYTQNINRPIDIENKLMVTKEERRWEG